MNPFHIKTPLVESKKLSSLAKKKVYLKLDNLQPSGSFKLRGIGNLALKAYEDSLITEHHMCQDA